MLKRKTNAIHSFILLLFIGCTINFVSGQAIYQRTYGTAADEYGIGIIHLDDGSSLMLCQVKEDDGVQTDFAIIQIDSVGAIIISKRYHIPGNQDVFHFQHTLDGGFLIAGDDVSSNPQHNFIVKLDQNFGLVWSKKITFHSKLISHVIKEDIQGNVYFGTDCRITPYSDFFLMKMDVNGNLLWQHSWGIYNNDHIYDIHFSSNGNLYIMGCKWTSTSELIVICMKPDGELIWEKSLFQDNQYYPRCMIELDNGEILMVVKAEHTGKTALIKMDNAFTPLWHKIIGSTSGDLYFWSGEFYNGEIFLAGNYDGNNGDVAVLNMTTDGTIKWAKAYGGEAEEQTIVKSKKSITCNSGSVFVIGSTEGFGVGMNDIYLIKADLNGTSGCNEIELSSTEGSLLYSPMVSDISINLVLQSSNLTVVPQGINDIEIVTLCPSGIVADFVSDVQIICVNDSVNFTDLSEPDSVSWNWQFEGGFPATSIVQNPQDIVYHNPGSFDVRLIVSDGINFDTLVKEDYIQVLPFAEIDLGDDQLFCDGDTLILDAGAGYDSYLWSNGDTSQAIRIIIPGMYWVSVTSEMECPGSDTINVVLLPDPEVSLGNDTLICFNEVLSLDAGAGFDSYLWQDGAQGQSLLVTEPGQYWVMVSNACGSGADTINVNFTEPYDISLGNDTSFCYGQSVVLDAGAGFEEYFWSTGDYTQTITATLGGNYWVQVTDAMGCSAVDSIYLDVFNDFEITIGSATQTICDGDYIFLNGPEGYQSYLWQDGSAGQSILADTAGVYWLEVTDENGCAARDSMELIVRVIAIFIGNDTILCEGSQVVLQTPPGFVSYHWHDGSTNPTFIATHEGIFWVEVTDELGCTGSDSVTVMLFEPPTLGMAHQEWMCPGDSLWLQADTGHLAYLWQDGTTTPEYLVTIPGLYQVQIETICGSYEDAVEIVLYSDNLNIGNDTTLCDGEIAVLWPGSGYTSHRWSTGATDSSIVVSSAGWYWLTAFDGFCNLTDSIRIDACADIRVPNVFTPNGDTYNDYFFAEPINPGGLTAFKMIIFNRWGRIVHELTHLDAQWDGKINGTDAAEGVYFWVCKYSAINKYGNVAERTKQGSVTLLR